MAAHRHREETINTQLAILLSRHGVSAESETIHRSGQARPDVMFLLGGVRVVIEGKFDDASNAEGQVLENARQRVRQGISHIAVALIYPKIIRTISTTKLEAKLAESSLKFLIVSETGETEWSQATPDQLLAALRRVRETLTQDDIVAASAKRLSERIEGVAHLWIGQSATCDRLSKTLGMPAKRGEDADERDERRVTAAKVAALVLANALIFQEQLAASSGDERIQPLCAFDHAPNLMDELKKDWHWIWSNINYVPIFRLGEEILAELPLSQGAISAVRWLIDEAKAICANQSALRHDLMGRIYHWLLHHAKYLGTYYTATSSATLLLKLCFAHDWPGQDFGATRKLTEFKVADLACGTGTLLMASAQALTDQFIVSFAKAGKKLEPTHLRTLHQTLMENILHGYDVLPSAVHLTASTLGMLAPEVTFRKMNLYIMPMGVQGRSNRLGSLDFIGRDVVATQMALDDSALEVRKTGVADEHYSRAEVPALDLCVMNPPFVRSVGGNLLFGSLPDDERSRLQAELKKRAKNLPASITAGLGSVFMAIADKHLRVGGRMAFILPIALATGEAWGESRRLLAEGNPWDAHSHGYHLETVIVSHDAERPNFSENTDLSELMFIARKLRKGEQAGETAFINLWHNPRTIYEAMDLAARLTPGSTGAVHGADGRKLAEVTRLPPPRGDDPWIGVQFAQPQTLLAASELAQGRLAVPGQAPVGLPLCRLDELGKLGYDRRDIHDAFTLSDWSPYPAFWNHDAKKVLTIGQSPNGYLTPRNEAAKGRKLKSATPIAQSAGRILLVERLWPITHRVMAVGFAQPVLGNTWWALKTTLTEAQDKALLLWLNSTPALLLFLARRVATRSAWMQVKKPAWAAMPVLDVRQLAPEALEALAAAYDALGQRELQALAKLEADPVRAAIDDALRTALNLPDMRKLRELLAREPGLTGKAIAPKQGEDKLFAEEAPANHADQLQLI